MPLYHIISIYNLPSSAILNQLLNLLGQPDRSGGDRAASVWWGTPNCPRRSVETRPVAGRRGGRCGWTSWQPKSPRRTTPCATCATMEGVSSPDVAGCSWCVGVHPEMYLISGGSCLFFFLKGRVVEDISWYIMVYHGIPSIPQDCLDPLWTEKQFWHLLIERESIWLHQDWEIHYHLILWDMAFHLPSGEPT